MMLAANSPITTGPVLSGSRASGSRRASPVVASSGSRGHDRDEVLLHRASVASGGRHNRHVSGGSSESYAYDGRGIHEMDSSKEEWGGNQRRRAAAASAAAVVMALSVNVDAACAKTVNISIDPATLTSQVCDNPRAAGVPGTATYKAKCMEILGTASNKAGETVYNADVYGVRREEGYRETD